MKIAVLLLLAASPFAAKYREAVQCITDRKFGEATALLNEIAAAEPRWAEVFSARCSAQLGLKRPDSAAADCRYALKLKPELVVALYGLATAEQKLGQKREAAGHFRQYASSTSPAATVELKATAAQSATLLESELGAQTKPDEASSDGTPVRTSDARRPAVPVVRNACNSDGVKPCTQ